MLRLQSAVLRLQSTVKENTIRNIMLLCKPEEHPHWQYFIQFWSCSSSKPYTGLRTAVSSIENVTKNAKMFKTLDNTKDANTVRTRLSLAALCMLETLE